jgi:hypothetical protein
MGQYRNYNNEDLTKAVKNNVSLAGVLRDLGLRIAGGNYDHLRMNIAKLDLDVSHFTGKVWSKGQTLKDWSLYKKDAGRKKVLIQERGYQCEDCKLTEWKNLPIVLELHHIDGNRLDNRKENLQLLCCNCHSVTENWRAKNIRNKASMAELVDAPDLDIYKLSDYNESYGLEPFKVGETLTDNADGNTELSLPNKKKSVESRRREPKFSICINCGTQNKNDKYCSAKCYREDNRKNVPKVPELLKTFIEHRSYCAVGRYYNVSDNAVRKWVLDYGIEDMVKVYSSAQTEDDSGN